MVKLIRKNTLFKWDNECQVAFQKLKDAFTSASILKHFDQEKEILVETDPSHYVSAGILSQRNEGGILQPVAVMNRTVASEFPAPVPYLPMFLSVSAILLVEIRLGYVLLVYSLWYFVIHFGNAL